MSLNAPRQKEFSHLLRKKYVGLEFILIIKASIIIGRDPDRWRLDALGNPVLKPLKTCDGPVCYQYDHIVPHSKGGHTHINNC